MHLMVIGLIVILSQTVVSHEAFGGKCPSVEPMEDFDMEKFEGLWYVIDVFEKDVKCMSWNFFKEDNKTWKIYESRQSGLLHSVGLDSSSANTATLTPKKDPGSYIVSWPLNIGGGYDLAIIHTDYDKYAGISSCQGLLLGHRQQNLVLSREPYLKSQFRQIIKGKMQKFGINPYYFKKVDQTRCGYDQDEKPIGSGPLGRGTPKEDPEYELYGDDEKGVEGDVIPRRWFGDYKF